ncbi:MAG TPA: ABC transporter permease [Anaerolineales bacterium]|jgi:hypothetical protein|nr:ABC transporter permease [Anaerolineales bacterium]
MFLKLFSIEWTRLARRSVLWVTFICCSLFIWLSLQNFYNLNRVQLLDGTLKMPGASFDLANALDQLLIISLPFLVIMAALMLGNDYSQRTNQHWLMRVSRPSSLLAKFCLLALVTFLLQLLILLVGGATGWYYKTFLYEAYTLGNVNLLAAISAAFYMTLVTLPYISLILLITVATRSAFAGIAIGLGYTQFIELLLSSVLYGADWAKWMMRNLYFSATYLLNSIGNRAVETPSYLLDPGAAFVMAAAYTIIFLFLAVRLYRHQDLGG